MIYLAATLTTLFVSRLAYELTVYSEWTSVAAIITMGLFILYGQRHHQ